MQTVRPKNGMEIRSSVRLEPGTYLVPDGICLAESGIDFDAAGVTLVGVDRQRTGLRMHGVTNVTVRGVRLREFHHGIAVTNSTAIKLLDCDVTSTAELPSNTLFLDIWRDSDSAYGAAVFVDECERVEISDCTLEHQMCGILLYRSRYLSVLRNACNYNSGFGIYLSATADSEFVENSCDYCCRFEPRAGGLHAGHMGADAAGFVAVRGSSRNRFLRNQSRMGGDGFFLAGLAPDGSLQGCNDNLFEENDASLSPNIAFEATFSSGNRFTNNFADRCNYGFWMGFSSDSIIEGNRVLFARQAGVGVENGVGFEVRRNHFQGCGHGVLLWSRPNDEFPSVPDNRTCKHWNIRENQFIENWKAVRIARSMDHGIRPLSSADSSEMPHSCRIIDNFIQGNHIGIELLGVEHSEISNNLLKDNAAGNLTVTDCGELKIGTNLGTKGAYL